MMTFFKNCKDVQELKAEFKKLALIHHPDRGGDTATMQKINAAYKFMLAKLLNNSSFTQEQKDAEFNFSEKYQNAINAIIGLELTIELVGSWVWVTGDTRTYKDQLKAAGFMFAPKKLAWYFRTEENKVRRGGKFSLDEIKNKYGSKTISGGRQMISK